MEEKYSIFFPTPLDEISCADNDNIDVCIKFQDGRSYTIVVTTPKNLDCLMNEWEVDYLPPTYRFIVVKKIDHSIIVRAVKELVMSQHMLSVYGDDIQ